MGILLTAHEEGRQIGVPAVEPARRIRFETQCLADISQFLAELMATRKAEA